MKEDHTLDGCEYAFVPISDVAEWEERGWVVRGPLPHQHALYSVLMRNDNEVLPLFDGIRREPQRLR